MKKKNYFPLIILFFASWMLFFAPFSVARASTLISGGIALDNLGGDNIAVYRVNGKIQATTTGVFSDQAAVDNFNQSNVGMSIRFIHITTPLAVDLDTSAYSEAACTVIGTGAAHTFGGHDAQLGDKFSCTAQGLLQYGTYDFQIGTKNGPWVGFMPVGTFPVANNTVQSGADITNLNPVVSGTAIMVECIRCFGKS